MHSVTFSKSKIIRRRPKGRPTQDGNFAQPTVWYVLIYAGVTSTSWCIYDSINKQWVGVREDHQREVASLTKIMTCIVSLELFQRYSMEQGNDVSI